MNETEMRALEAQINLALLDDIISFVVRTADAARPQKQLLEQRCMFPIRAASASLFQERYGFMYLGELLERYEERFGMSEPDRRAIALALGYTRDIATKEMFVGSQRDDFLRAIEQAALGDAYLTGALYLLNEGDVGGPAYEKWLIERQYTQTEELLFVMSLFEPERALELFKSQLVLLLGPSRTMPVLENTKIFGWLTARLFPQKKLLKAREFAAIRALLALPCSFIRPDSKKQRNEDVGGEAIEMMLLKSKREADSKAKKKVPPAADKSAPADNGDADSPWEDTSDNF